MQTVPSRKSALVKGALMTFLHSKIAMDAKIDLTRALAGVTQKNFGAKKAAIISDIKRQTAGKLTADADLEKLPQLMDALQDVEEPDEEDAEEKNDDGAFFTKIQKWLKENLPPDLFLNFENFIGAADSPPDFPGKPKTGGGMVAAMDAASDSYDKRFPSAKKIRVIDTGESPATRKPANTVEPPSPPRPKQQPVDHHAAANRLAYDQRFPSASRIRHV